MSEEQDVICTFNQKALSEYKSISEQHWEDNAIPLVSISCTAYNHENYVSDAIESFLSQKTNFPVEILIHDDASTDNTADIIRGYEKQYPHLIKAIYQKENQYSKKDGTLGRIQRDRAKGKYYALCEGDDYWTDPCKLQKQVDLIEQNPECSMCVAKTEWVKNNEIIYVSGEGNKLKYDFYDIIDGPYFHTSTYLIRKEFLDLYSSSSPKLRDGDTSMRLFLSDLGPLLLLNEKVSVYRITGNGIWTGISRRKKIHWRIRVRKAFYYNFKRKYRPLFLKVLIDNYLDLLIINLRQFHHKEFLSVFFQLLFWGSKNPLHFIKSAYNSFKSLILKKIKRPI